MDPCSAVGLVSGAVTVALAIGTAIQRLRTLQGQYSSSEQVLDSIVNRLTVIRCSIEIITKSEEGAVPLHPTAEQYRAALKLSLEGCRKVLESLDIQIKKLFDANGRVGFRQKGRYLFNGDCLKEYLSRLDNEIQSLNLLLSCYQNVALQEQNRLLRERSTSVRVQTADSQAVNTSTVVRSIDVKPPQKSDNRSGTRNSAELMRAHIPTIRRRRLSTAVHSYTRSPEGRDGMDDLNMEDNDNFFFSGSDADESESLSEDDETLVESDSSVVGLTSTSPRRAFHNPYLKPTGLPPSPPDSLPSSSPIKSRCQASSAMPPTPPDSLPESSLMMELLEQAETFHHSRSESSDDAYSSCSSSSPRSVAPDTKTGCISASTHRLRTLQAFSGSENESGITARDWRKYSRCVKGKSNAQTINDPGVSNQCQALDEDRDFDSTDSIFHLEM